MGCLCRKMKSWLAISFSSHNAIAANTISPCSSTPMTAINNNCDRSFPTHPRSHPTRSSSSTFQPRSHYKSSDRTNTNSRFYSYIFDLVQPPAAKGMSRRAGFHLLLIFWELVLMAFSLTESFLLPRVDSNGLLMDSLNQAQVRQIDQGSD